MAPAAFERSAPPTRGRTTESTPGSAHGRRQFSGAEECPPWPGQPITGHWGLPDPVKATGTDAEKALVFAQTYAALRRRVQTFVSLPFATLDRLSLQRRVDDIGVQPAH